MYSYEEAYHEKNVTKNTVYGNRNNATLNEIVTKLQEN